jgi:small subunit ribosomal protein S21
MSVKVIVEGKNIGKALSQLECKLGKEGVLIEMRKREAYEKPSTRRRRKLAIMQRRCKKAEPTTA